MTKKYQPTGTYQLTTHIAVVLLLLILIVSVGYFFFLGRPDESAARLAMQEEWQVAQALWQDRKPGQYRYVVDRSCKCPNEIDTAYVATIGRSSREAEFLIPIESSAGLLLTTPPDPVWIDDVFELIQRRLWSGGVVEIQYNYLYGYPELVDINPGGNSSVEVDRFEIRDFEVLHAK